MICKVSLSWKIADLDKSVDLQSAEGDWERGKEDTFQSGSNPEVLRRTQRETLFCY